MLLTGLLVAGAIGAVAGGIKGWAQNEADKNTVKELKLQRAQAQEAGANNILDQRSSLVLNNYLTADSIGSEIDAYNLQLNQLAMQSAQSYGSTVAQSAQTGFRNSGANANGQRMQETANKFNSTYLTSQLNAQRTASGASQMSMQSSTLSAINGYRMNISQAVKTADMKIKNIGAENNYFLSGRMWTDVGLGAVDGALSYAGSTSSINEMGDWIEGFFKKD